MQVKIYGAIYWLLGKIYDFTVFIIGLYFFINWFINNVRYALVPIIFLNVEKL